MSYSELRELLGMRLQPAHTLQAPQGLTTGLSCLDDYLLWKGLPPSELTVLLSRPGQGATSLWIRTAQTLIQQGKKVAWVTSQSWLMPEHLKRREMPLENLFIVRQQAPNKLFWVLQELITSTLFEMVGCQLSSKGLTLKNSELQKLKHLAKAYKVALVFLTPKLSLPQQSLFALIIDFQQGNLQIRRALHRPTPYSINTQEALLANPMFELSSSLKSMVS